MMQLTIVKSEPSTPTKITVVETIYDCISDPYRLRRLLQLTYFLLKHQRHQILSLSLSLSLSETLYYISIFHSLFETFFFLSACFSSFSFPYSLFSFALLYFLLQCFLFLLFLVFLNFLQNEYFLFESTDLGRQKTNKDLSLFWA